MAKLITERKSKPYQYIEGGMLSYIDEDGYEDADAVDMPNINKRRKVI